MTYIYALVDPLTSECRYVGKADDLRTRFRKHLASSTVHRTHKSCWIKKLRKDGLQPIIVTLEQVPKAEWVEAEQFWIAYFRFLGARLTNATDGGEGAEGLKLSETTKAAISARAKLRVGALNPLYGKSHSPQTRAIIRAKALGRTLSDTHKQKISIGVIEAFRRPETAEKLVAARARPVSEETRKKISEAGKGRVKSEGTRKKLSAALKGRVFSVEHVAKIAAANKGKKMSAEARAKMSAASKGKPKTPEHTAKVAEGCRRRWEKWREENGKEPARSTKRRWKTGEIPHPIK